GMGASFAVRPEARRPAVLARGDRPPPGGGLGTPRGCAPADRGFGGPPGGSGPWPATRAGRDGAGRRHPRAGHAGRGGAAGAAARLRPAGLLRGPHLPAGRRRPRHPRGHREIPGPAGPSRPGPPPRPSRPDRGQRCGGQDVNPQTPDVAPPPELRSRVLAAALARRPAGYPDPEALPPAVTPYAAEVDKLE